MSNNIGIITEQGDLGLGFNQLNKKDKKAYGSQDKSNSNSEKETKEK